MSTIGLLAALALVVTLGVVLAISGWLQPAPSLSRTLQHIQRSGPRMLGEFDPATGAARLGPTPTSRATQALSGMVNEGSSLIPSHTQLKLLGRSPEQHVVYLVTASLAGLVLPTVAIAALQRLGAIDLQWYAPLGAGLLVALLAPLVVHATSLGRAEEIHGDLRYQVSAYLDVVTMLLAGNTGYEGSLEQAAHAGDGRLFAELRRRMRESGARGASLTDALHRVGVELGLDELEQIAATAALSAAEGAPVARTLAAKCATLRAALSSEQESEARLRTSRLTTPIVGMALIFMALVMYPALTFA